MQKWQREFILRIINSTGRQGCRKVGASLGSTRELLWSMSSFVLKYRFYN